MNTGQGLSRPWTTSWLPLRISESSRPSEAAHEPIGDSDLDRDPLHDVAGDVPPSGSMSMTRKRLTQAVDGPRLLMISAITGASHTGPVAALWERNRAIVEAV